jgi:hypothetical protein
MVGASGAAEVLGLSKRSCTEQRCDFCSVHQAVQQV